jgi:small subunit ribosomal protein S1
MVNKPISRTLQQGGPPPIDESWWSAILAEDGKPISKDVRPSQPGLNKEPRPLNVDWDHARIIYERDETVSLLVTGYNRGGLLVEGENMQGFVPVSHLVNIPCEKSDDERDRLLGRYVESSLVLKVIECDPSRGRVVFSERAALSEPGRRTALLDMLQPGGRVWGQVTNITDFGVFVDLGGLEGLVHVSELSWGRVRHPADMVNISDRIQVFIISVDRERLRVALSLKRLIANPWETAEERYTPGQVVEAEVTSVMHFGAFARLEEGLDGLIHISEMDTHNGQVKPDELIHEGSRVMVRILQVDASRQRLGLSLILEPEDA